MNYRDEVTAFNGQLEAGTLSACEIALWHALHDVSIQCGHSDGLSIATVTLMARTGFSTSSIKRARDALRDKGFVRYASRGANRAAVYEILSVAHREPQREPQREPRDGPQGEPQREPRDGPLYTTTTTKDMDVNISAHGEPQGEPQDGPQPWLTDEEGDRLRRSLDDVLIASARIGIPQTPDDMEEANRITSEYTAAWVLEAIRRAVKAPASARCWRYIEGTLRKWRESGGIDDAGKPRAAEPPDAQEAETERREREARKQYQERSARILRGEYT